MDKKIIPIILLLSILVAPMILADSIADSQITIKVYNTTKYVNGSVTINVEVINGDYAGNNKNYSIKINNSKAISSSNDFKFQLIQNASIANLDYLIQYTKCIEEKAGFERAWQQCHNEQTITNSTDCKIKLDNCNLNLKEKDLTIGSLNEDINDLNDEQTKTKNQKWVYGIIGLLAGILGYAFKEGKIGYKVKDKYMEGFNPSLNS